MRVIALTEKIRGQGGEAVGSCETPPVPSGSNDVFMDANEFSQTKLHSSRQSLYLSAQSSEVEGFDDVGTLLTAGDLGLMMDHPSSATPQASTTAEKPDPYNPSKRKGYVLVYNFISELTSSSRVRCSYILLLMLFRTAVNLIAGMEQVHVMG